jgi:hypothetical protein
MNSVYASFSELFIEDINFSPFIATSTRCVYGSCRLRSSSLCNSVQASCFCYRASKGWAQQPILDLGLLVEVHASISPGYPLTRIVCRDGRAPNAVWALPVVTLTESTGLPPPRPAPL